MFVEHLPRYQRAECSPSTPQPCAAPSPQTSGWRGCVEGGRRSNSARRRRSRPGTCNESRPAASTQAPLCSQPSRTPWVLILVSCFDPPSSGSAPKDGLPKQAGGSRRRNIICSHKPQNHAPPTEKVVIDALIECSPARVRLAIRLGRARRGIACADLPPLGCARRRHSDFRDIRFECLRTCRAPA